MTINGGRMTITLDYKSITLVILLEVKVFCVLFETEKGR